MSDLSDAADRWVSSVRSSYSDLRAATGVHWWSSDAQDEVSGAVVRLGSTIDVWAGTHRTWYVSGVGADGAAFDRSRWVDEGNAIVSEIGAQGGNFSDGSAIQAAADAAAQSADDLATRANSAAQSIGNGLLSPWVWWVGGGVLVLLLAGPYLIPLVKKLGKAAAS